MSSPQIDLDKLEQAAKAAQEHSVAIGCDWLTEQEAACNMEQADAAFVAAASPQVVLELISRLRTAEENYQAATLRANANAEMLKGLLSQQQAESVALTNEQIEELWWGELDNRSLGCIRNIIAAAQTPAVAATAPESVSQQ